MADLPLWFDSHNELIEEKGKGNSQGVTNQFYCVALAYYSRHKESMLRNPGISHEEH